MTKFEDSLWRHLVAEHGAETARFGVVGASPCQYLAPRSLETVNMARSRRRRLLSGGLLATAACVAVVLVFIATSGTTPAYALDRNPNGSYTLRIFTLTGHIGSLNAKLASLHIYETVIPVTDTCPVRGFFGYAGAPARTSITLTPGDANRPHGYTAYLAATPNADGTIALAVGTMKPPLPVCFSTHSTRFNLGPTESPSSSPSDSRTIPRN